MKKLNEEQLFTNNSKILEKENKELNKIIFILRVLPIIGLYEIVALILTIYGLVINNYLIAIIFGFFMIFFPGCMILVSSLRTKSIYKKYQEIYNNSIYNYFFYDDGFKVILNYKNNSNDAYYRYTDLKVVETEENIFLFVSSSSAFVVNINGFSENFDRLGFRSVLQGKVKKYRFWK